MQCTRCPTPDDLACPGFDVRRFCELIDPSCPHHDPGYIEVIVREAHRARYDTDTRHDSDQNPGSGTPFIDQGGTTAFPADCCGGGVPPGIYDEPRD